MKGVHGASQPAYLLEINTKAKDAGPAHASREGPAGCRGGGGGEGKGARRAKRERREEGGGPGYGGCIVQLTWRSA